MAQYANPDADLVDGTFLDEGAGAVDLYDGLPPIVPGTPAAGDDATYIESIANPTSEACGFGLETLEDPVSQTGHIMRWRRAKNAAGGATMNMDVELRMGYIDEGTQGTLINGFADNDLPDAFANTSDTLSAGEADAITDYADLQIRFVVSQV